MTRNYVSPQQVLELKCSWSNLPVIWRMMSISKFEYPNGFIFQNTYNLMDNSPLSLNWKVRLVIHQEHFLVFRGRSWLLGHLENDPSWFLPPAQKISVCQMTGNYVSSQQVLALKCSWYSLPITWRMMSLSKFEYPNGFIFQNTYNLKPSNWVKGLTSDCVPSFKFNG